MYGVYILSPHPFLHSHKAGATIVLACVAEQRKRKWKVGRAGSVCNKDPHWWIFMTAKF